MKEQWKILKKAIKDDIKLCKVAIKENKKDNDFAEALNSQAVFHTFDYLKNLMDELDGTRWDNITLSKEEFEENKKELKNG